MSGKDVREFLYSNMRTQNRYETDDGAGQAYPAFDPARDERVLGLLNQLGERLIRSERERLEMKETVGRYADLIDALENKVKKQSVFEDEILARQEKLERDYASQMQKMQKAVMLAERIEDAINQQNRLARRIEQITQDKARMLRKLERIEEAVVETQTALNAKSLVLMSDQTSVANQASARIPHPANGNNPLWQSTTMRRLASTAAVIGLIAGLSWGVYQSLPQARFQTETPVTETAATENLLATPPFTRPDTTDTYDRAPARDERSNAYEDVTPPPAEALNAPTEPEEITIADASVPDEAPAPVAEEIAPEETPSVVDTAPVENILEKSDDELVKMLNDDPDALAAALNNIAPGAAGVPQNMAEDTPPAAAAPAPAPVKKAAAPDTSLDDFLNAQKDSRPVSQRIQPDPNLPAALKEVEKKAFEGVPEAQHDLAALYTAGQGGVKTDFARAAQWFEEAALGNIANARYNLGVLYHQGLGVSQDMNKAISWYKAAAAQGHPEAQYNLGIAYIEGVGAEYNPQKAADNFESAARSGILEAAYNLGLIHENGLLGTPKVDDAVYWYNRAAIEGSPEGKAALNQLARNMNYSEARIQDIYNKRKAVLEGATAKAPVTAAPAVVTPVSAPAAAPSRERAPVDDIPVLPLDKEAALEMDAAPQAVAAKPKAASSSTRDAGVIAQIQEQLMNYGLYPGPADGVYNDVVADAIRSYQKSNDLATDGRANEALLVHMLAQEMGSQE